MPNEYMKTKVKSVWGAGLVSVNSKYVDKALENNLGLAINCKGATMRVDYESLKDKKPRGGSFDDKFGRKNDYVLYDFFWKADDE